MLPPAGAADAMHVIGKTPRQIVIDDVRHSINVDAAGGDISRYEHVCLTALKTRQRALTLSMTLIAVN